MEGGGYSWFDCTVTAKIMSLQLTQARSRNEQTPEKDKKLVTDLLRPKCPAAEYLELLTLLPCVEREDIDKALTEVNAKDTKGKGKSEKSHLKSGDNLVPSNAEKKSGEKVDPFRISLLNSVIFNANARMCKKFLGEGKNQGGDAFSLLNVLIGPSIHPGQSLATYFVIYYHPMGMKLLWDGQSDTFDWNILDEDNRFASILTANLGFSSLEHQIGDAGVSEIEKRTRFVRLVVALYAHIIISELTGNSSVRLVQWLSSNSDDGLEALFEEALQRPEAKSDLAVMRKFVKYRRSLQKKQKNSDRDLLSRRTLLFLHDRPGFTLSRWRQLDPERLFIDFKFSPTETIGHAVMELLKKALTEFSRTAVFDFWESLKWNLGLLYSEPDSLRLNITSQRLAALQLFILCEGAVPLFTCSSYNPPREDKFGLVGSTRSVPSAPGTTKLSTVIIAQMGNVSALVERLKLQQKRMKALHEILPEPVRVLARLRYTYYLLFGVDETFCTLSVVNEMKADYEKHKKFSATTSIQAFISEYAPAYFIKSFFEFFNKFLQGGLGQAEKILQVAKRRVLENTQNSDMIQLQNAQATVTWMTQNKGRTSLAPVDYIKVLSCRLSPSLVSHDPLSCIAQTAVKAVSVMTDLGEDDVIEEPYETQLDSAYNSVFTATEEQRRRMEGRKWLDESRRESRFHSTVRSGGIASLVSSPRSDERASTNDGDATNDPPPPPSPYRRASDPKSDSSSSDASSLSSHEALENESSQKEREVSFSDKAKALYHVERLFDRRSEAILPWLETFKQKLETDFKVLQQAKLLPSEEVVNLLERKISQRAWIEPTQNVVASLDTMARMSAEVSKHLEDAKDLMDDHTAEECRKAIKEADARFTRLRQTITLRGVIDMCQQFSEFVDSKPFDREFLNLWIEEYERICLSYSQRVSDIWQRQINLKEILTLLLDLEFERAETDLHNQSQGLQADDLGFDEDFKKTAEDLYLNEEDLGRFIHDENELDTV